MKWSSFILTILFFSLLAEVNAQRVSYTVLDQNPDYYTNRYHAWFTLPDINTVNGLGFMAGYWGDVEIPNTRFIVRPRLNLELFGVGNDRFRILKDSSIRRMTETDLMVKFKLIPGRIKDAKINITLESTNTSVTKLRGVKAKRKTDLLLRGGFYRWGYNNFRTTGVTYGISIRDKRHSKIEIEGDDDYTYTGDFNTEFYADLMFLPFNNVLASDSKQPKKLGYRIGFNRGDNRMNYFCELALRPGYQPGGMDFFILQGWSFGFSN